VFMGDDWAEDHHDVELMDVAVTRSRAQPPTLRSLPAATLLRGRQAEALIVLRLTRRYGRPAAFGSAARRDRLRLGQPGPMQRSGEPPGHPGQHRTAASQPGRPGPDRGPTHHGGSMVFGWISDG
jgi:hypothetical protein